MKKASCFVLFLCFSSIVSASITDTTDLKVKIIFIDSIDKSTDNSTYPSKYKVLAVVQNGTAFDCVSRFVFSAPFYIRETLKIGLTYKIKVVRTKIEEDRLSEVEKRLDKLPTRQSECYKFVLKESDEYTYELIKHSLIKSRK